MYTHLKTSVRKSNAFLLLLFSAFLFQPALSQSKIALYRIGVNKIFITNNAFHSITVSVGSQQRITIPRTGTSELDYSLSYKNLNETPLIVNYDYHAYQLDSLLCVNAAKRQEIENNKFHIWMSVLAGLFHEDMNFEAFIFTLKGIAYFGGVTTERLDKLIEELTSVWLEGSSTNEKRNRMEALIKSYIDQSNEIEINREKCVDNAYSLLGEVAPSTYYGIQFIQKQEHSRFEFSPFFVIGTRIRSFEEIINQNTIKKMNYNARPSYGGRLAYVFNAYKKGRRKIDTKYFFPFTYSQTRATYKLVQDSVYTAGSGFSWSTYSVGFGWMAETYNQRHTKATSALSVDIGLISSMLAEHKIESGKIISTHHKSSFRGFSPYISINYKQRIVGPIDIVGSYYSTLLYSSLKYKKYELPNFYQFHLGLTLNFGYRNSYQY